MRITLTLIWKWIKVELAMLLAILTVVVFGLLLLGALGGGIRHLVALDGKIDVLGDRIHSDIAKATAALDATLKAEGIEDRTVATATRNELKGAREDLASISNGLDAMSKDNARRLDVLEESNKSVVEAIKTEARTVADAAKQPAPQPPPAVQTRPEAASDERSSDDRPPQGGVAMSDRYRHDIQLVHAGEWVTGLSEKDLQHIAWISNREAVIARIHYRPGFFQKTIDVPLPVNAFPRNTESIDLFAKDDFTITW